MGAGSVVVLVEVSKYWNDFKVGAFTGDAQAELTMNVQVKRRDGSIAFTKVVTGLGENAGILAASGANAKIVLDAALRNAIGRLVSDSGFIDALLHSSAAAATPAPAS